MRERDDRDASTRGSEQPDTMTEVYRREAPRLARFFRRHVAERDEVSDLVQEAFTRLIGAGSGPGPARPAAYLQRIARNLLFDRSRRASIRLARFHVPFDEAPHLSSPPDQSDAMEAADLMRTYRRVVEEMPDKTRDAFLLHRVDGLGYREVGERLGISIPTVQYHVARALMHLDRALDTE